ncbi:MAG: hypothetical protein ACLS95_02840 [Clostridia bacterium]
MNDIVSLNTLVYCITESLTCNSSNKELKVAACFFTFLAGEVAKDLVTIYNTDSSENIPYISTESCEHLYEYLFYLSKCLQSKLSTFMNYVDEFIPMYV